MKRTLIACASSVLLLWGIQANALSIDIIEITGTTTKETAFASWVSANGLSSDIIVLEDFEDELSGTWYESLTTGIGTFSSGGLAGSGTTAYSPYDGIPRFSIQDDTNLTYVSYAGRNNQTPGGAQFLDSGDISLLTLNIDQGQNLTNLFFYMQDPSDVGATTTVTSTSVSSQFSDNPLANEGNANLFFVGITAGDLEGFLTSISWSVSTTNDGYGLDDFTTTVASVPEPATIFLFGSGLAGLIGIRARRRVIR